PARWAKPRFGARLSRSAARRRVLRTRLAPLARRHGFHAMKTTFPPPTLLLLALFLHSANLAAQPAPRGHAAERPADRPETTPPPADDEDHQDVRGRMMSALKNTEVVGTQNETLGRLADFVADIETGQIIYGVVEPGPSGGPDTQRVAPFPAFIPELAGN